MRFGTVYAPAELVVVSVATPVAIFLAETFAPGMVPPCGSVIVPDSVPPATCARSGSEIARQNPRIHPKNTYMVALVFIKAFLSLPLLLLDSSKTSPPVLEKQNQLDPKHEHRDGA